jgi:hypothetical protein
MREAVPAFHHLAHAQAHELVGREAIDALSSELDGALRHLAPLGVQQVRDGLERGRLARAVRTEEGDDAAFRHLERHALQHQDDVVVDDLDVVDRQIRAGRGLRRCGHVAERSMRGTGSRARSNTGKRKPGFGAG